MLQNVDNFISETSGISGIRYAVEKAKRSMILGVAALLVACSGN